MNKLEYDDKRLLMFLSGCLILGLVLGFTFGFLLPPSQSKINNQALIQNFNKSHYNMLSSRDFSEYSDDEKINFITGYDMGFQQGREHEISKYNEIKAQKQEEIEDRKRLIAIKIQNKQLETLLKKYDTKNKKLQGK